MLLKREGINPDQPGTKNGRAAFSCAARQGHEEVVKMQLCESMLIPTRQTPNVAGRHSGRWLGTGMRGR